MNNVKGKTFSVKNVKLFSEYERQIKRRLSPIQHEHIGYGLVENNEEIWPEQFLEFDYVYNGVSNHLKLHAPDEPVNGDIECELYLQLSDYDWRCIKFKESRKPMEMNIDNMLNVAKMMIEMYKENKNG